MPEPELFLLFGRRLEAAGIDYMVTGSVASMAYGEPRLTMDVDLVVALSDSAVDALAEAFPLEEFYCPPAEVLRVEVARRHRGHFNLIHHDSGFKADIYVMGDDPLHAWAFERRHRLDVEGGALYFAPPEYVVIRKLEYYREGGSPKHLDDIRGILRHASDVVDRKALDRWISRLGLEPVWAEV
jgi:hypothetical protein